MSDPTLDLPFFMFATITLQGASHCVEEYLIETEAELADAKQELATMFAAHLQSLGSHGQWGFKVKTAKTLIATAPLPNGKTISQVWNADEIPKGNR